MAGSTGKFRSTVWDPVLIISQIIAVQAVFYTSLGMWTFIFNTFIRRPVSINQLFDASEIEASTLEGRLYLSCYLLNSISSAVSLWFIVQRAKQCLDFAVTLHFLHFVCCCCIVGFPRTGMWWAMNVVTVILTSVLSEYLCMRYELKAIPVTNSAVS